MNKFILWLLVHPHKSWRGTKLQYVKECYAEDCLLDKIFNEYYFLKLNYWRMRFVLWIIKIAG